MTPETSHQRTRPRRRLRVRFCAYAGILLVLLVGYWLSAGPAPSEVVLRGGPNEMGRAAGERFSVRIRLLSRVYLRALICGNDEVLWEAQKAHALAAVKQWEPRYREELEALAEGAGVSDGAMAFGNTFLDGGSGQVACRSVALEAPGGMLHAHNMDWDSLAGLANWSVVLLRRYPDDGRFATVSVGFPGLVGSLSVINEHGIGLSVNQAPWTGAAAGDPVFVRVRRVAETCRRFDQAVAALRETDPNVRFFILVSSATEQRAAWFQPDAEQWRVNEPVDGTVAGGNAFLSKTEASSVWQVTREMGPTDAMGLIGVLRDERVMQACNIYSVVFDYAANRLWLASGKTPAAVLDYREFELFDPP